MPALVWPKLTAVYAIRSDLTSEFLGTGVFWVFEIAPILQRERENRLYGFAFLLGN